MLVLFFINVDIYVYASLCNFLHHAICNGIICLLFLPSFFLFYFYLDDVHDDQNVNNEDFSSADNQVETDQPDSPDMLKPNKKLFNRYLSYDRTEVKLFLYDSLKVNMIFLSEVIFV